MFFMALRYDGTEANTEDLKLSDCPCTCTGEMGLLHDLLVWNSEDPPNDAERERNEGVCGYQNNRNPFIDFPDLGDLFFNATVSPSPCPACECSTTDPEDDEIDLTEGPLLNPGDMAIVGFNSDSPKGIAILFVNDVPAGATFSITDDGWQGSSAGFRDSEGTISAVVGADGAPQGSVLHWNYGEENAGWSLDGSLNPSTSGDSFLIYQGTAAAPAFLFALTYQSSGFVPDGTTISSTTTTLPDGLVEGETAVALKHKDNYRFEGNLTGLGSEVLEQVADEANWKGDNTASSLPALDSSYQSSNSESVSLLFVGVGSAFAIGLIGAAMYMHKHQPCHQEKEHPPAGSQNPEKIVTEMTAVPPGGPGVEVWADHLDEMGTARMVPMRQSLGGSITIDGMSTASMSAYEVPPAPTCTLTV
jgi:hypothetical protein